MGNTKDLSVTVTCASGLERALKSELNRLNLGGDNLPAVNGAITFDGDFSDVAKANVFLRTADRVYIKLKQFECLSFDQLFDNVKSIPFENFIDKRGEVIVDGNCVKSKLFAISACQKIVKKAIAERLCKKYSLNRLPEDGAPFRVNFYIYKDVAEIRLNTSGTGLYKRGYRNLVGIAPIKETLAAGMLLYSDFYYKRPFFDPFCGSGTILIEAAMIALSVAPGLKRKFDFFAFKNFDKKAYDIVTEEAKDGEHRERKLDFYGFDVDEKAVKLTLNHAERAGVLKNIDVSRRAIKDFKTDFDCGTIVTNPPYGDRVYGRKEADECYKYLGKAVAENKGLSAFVITDAKNFEKMFGKKADRVRKLYNSEKECNFYYYYANKGEKND